MRNRTTAVRVRVRTRLLTDEQVRLSWSVFRIKLTSGASVAAKPERVRVQPADATQSLKRSAGVSSSSVWRGPPLS